MSKRSLTRFWRGARQHPKWDMGTPPNFRGKNRYHRRGRGAFRGRLFRWLLIAVFLLTVMAPLIDTVNGWVKPHEGCRVSAVVDGDTVKMHCPETGFESGRLMGFDTPELFSPSCVSEWGQAVAATYYLRWRLLRAGHIGILPRDTDRYGRRLVLMSLDGIPVAQTMQAAGLARHYDGGRRQSWCS